MASDVSKHWGYYSVLAEGVGYRLKLLVVQPGQALSTQCHSHRSEHWVVAEGVADILLDDKKYKLYAGQAIDIPLGSKHRLLNRGSSVLKIIELWCGTFLSEEDITLHEDNNE